MGVLLFNFLANDQDIKYFEYFLAKGGFLKVQKLLHLLHISHFHDSKIFFDNVNQETRLKFILKIFINPFIVSFKYAHNCNKDFVIEFLEISHVVSICKATILNIFLLGEELGQIASILEKCGSAKSELVFLAGQLYDFDDEVEHEVGDVSDERIKDFKEDAQLACSEFNQVN